MRTARLSNRSPRGEFLRQAQAESLTREVKIDAPVRSICHWCCLIARAIFDVVPRPSLEQCGPHAELNQEWTTRMRRLKIADDAKLEKLRVEILRRGIAITKPVNNSGAA